MAIVSNAERWKAEAQRLAAESHALKEMLRHVIGT